MLVTSASFRLVRAVLSNRRWGARRRSPPTTAWSPVADVRTVFAVYEVACVTQPRLFLGCYAPRG